MAPPGITVLDPAPLDHCGRFICCSLLSTMESSRVTTHLTKGLRERGRVLGQGAGCSSDELGPKHGGKGQERENGEL